jgi:hypothetical protein
MKKVELTAIIVNDNGEAFVRWAMRVAFTVTGAEDFYMVPVFAKQETVVFGDPFYFQPEWMSRSKRRHYTVNKPYVFSSVRSAEKAMQRMYGCGRKAVVT